MTWQSWFEAAVDPIVPSGLFLSNRLARIIYLSLADVLGEDGLHVILNHAELPECVGQLPPGDGEKQVDFAEISSLFRSLEDLYGERSSRGMALRAGKAMWRDVLSLILPKLEISDDIPLNQRLHLLLLVIGEALNHETDMQVAEEMVDEACRFTVEHCPEHWGRKSAQAGCHLVQGVIEAAVEANLGEVDIKIYAEIDALEGGSLFCISVVPFDEENDGRDTST